VKHNTSAPDVWAAILGGINENMSTGLRKWAAKQDRRNYAALALVSILATIDGDKYKGPAASSIYRSADTWTGDADCAVLRPWAQEALGNLQNHIPKQVIDLPLH